MKHLKLFETYSETLYQKIKHDFLMTFESSNALDEFLLDSNNVDDLDDIDWENVSYDIIQELNLNYVDVNYEELVEIVNTLLSEEDLDDYYEPRDGDHKAWVYKKEMEKNVDKYNL